ncbi:MAG: TonB-dependent receptor, partial [Gammaproteobacteria bacterium]
MLTSMRRLVSVLAVACGLVVIYEPVWAQTQTLEEVVVTARRRDEAIQNVPVTVNVFTEQAIESAGIESPRDFVAMVPNMTLVEVQNVGNSFITIRGISQARNSEPSVAVLVDGVLETNPYQFDQELTDIREIEVLKGPQGAVYGRNAIGGAILIHTVDPSDHFSGAARVGVGNGTSEKAQVAVSGPIDSAGTLKVRASLNYYNTDGYRQNAFLDRKADPYRDYSGRLRLLWKPSEQWSADLRALFDRVETTAFYYIIPRNLEANPFASFTTPPNANDVTSAIQNSNLGTDNRDVADVALKFDFNLGPGTLTAVSDYNRTKEIDTGDAYDFRPITTSIAYNCPPCFLGPRPPPTAAQGGPFDLSQSQFIDVTTYSQELRFTSSKIGGFSWIAGAYYVHTERFISTDNLFDRGAGIPAVYETPRVDPANPYATNTNITFLSDSQNNNAWAVFGDGTYEFTKQLELDAAIRYDEDQRQNTTRTPTQFLPDSTAKTGEVRKHTFDAAQPKGTLRYKPTDNLTLYGGWSRGFRSGGFNQTGVGAVAQASGNLGVHDLFNAEIAETWEVGLKSQFLDRRLGANLALYYTASHDG